MNKKWIVTNYKMDVSWVDKYTDNYIIYDKTSELKENDNIKHQPNIGYNIYDIFYFIVSNYDNLPDVCVFIKGNVFNRYEPHCNIEKFNSIITNNTLTPLESYEHIPESTVHIKGEDGGYMEINNSFYMYSSSPYIKRYFNSLDQFMEYTFTNYKRLGWIRFAPGCNYIVPKENILKYSKQFYERLLSYVSYSSTCMEAHMLERSMYLIFSNHYEERII